MRIGIDLGGTKIEAIILDENGAERHRIRASTPQGDYDAILKTIRDLTEQITKMADVSNSIPIGVGIPGTISSHTGLIKNSNSVCLIGHPLDKDLEAILKRPVMLANDADCFSISEATDGAGAGANVVFGVILGTGVGGGIVFNRSPLKGPNSITGEWGHIALPWPQTLSGDTDERPGPDCYCGLSGCVETYLSGPGMVRDHERCSGKTLTTQEIVSGADAGDPECEATLERYEHRLARGLASLINIIDPDVIVLGGGMSNIKRLYKRVPAIWEEWVFSDQCDTQLKQNAHGDSSGVRGAAWLWNPA